MRWTTGKLNKTVDQVELLMVGSKCMEGSGPSRRLLCQSPPRWLQGTLGHTVEGSVVVLRYCWLLFTWQ